MTRLITFGCSCTYGHGLEDCIDLSNNRPGLTPSEYAWPNILAKQLNYQCVNQSKPGASNLEILHHILNFKFEPTDLVVILWTYPGRGTTFTKEIRGPNREQYQSYGAWMTNMQVDGVDNIVEKWISCHTDHDLMIKSLIYIHHANSHLKNLSIQKYDFHVDLDLVYNEPEYLKVDRPYHKLLEYKVLDLALDNSHAGIKSHQEYANNLYQIINGKYLGSTI